MDHPNGVETNPHVAGKQVLPDTGSMTLRSALLFGLVLSAALVGCATPDNDPRLVVGTSTEADVQARLGPPTRTWPEPDGGRTLEYAHQPYGTRCDMLRFDAAGHLLSHRDALVPAERARVVPGMSVEQVQRLLGHERTRQAFANSGEEVWDWNVASIDSIYWMRFNVHFKDGVVVRTSETLVDPSRLRWVY